MCRTDVVMMLKCFLTCILPSVEQFDQYWSIAFESHSFDQLHLVSSLLHADLPTVMGIDCEMEDYWLDSSKASQVHLAPGSTSACHCMHLHGIDVQLLPTLFMILVT
jgi:hypothetical protein